MTRENVKNNVFYILIFTISIMYFHHVRVDMIQQKVIIKNNENTSHENTWILSKKTLLFNRK